MKSEKITNMDKLLKSRWYDDACGTALGLEFIGERWSLLIMRELMFGGRRFSELRAGLPGLSANVLTQRLARMEAVGILTRRKLPAPHSVQIYELTEWGYEAEVILQEIGRWATRSPLHDPTLPLSAASIMMSFRTMLNAGRSAGLQTEIGFRFGQEGFVGSIAQGRIAIQRADPAGRAAVTFDTDPMTLASIVYGGRPIADAEGAGALTLQGSRAVAEKFVTLFVLPPKIAWPPVRD